MKTREKGYNDYNLTKEEIKSLLNDCQKSENYDAVIEASKSANKDIYIALSFSLAYDVSYDKITKWCYIPYGKGDFYAYRRKAVNFFKTIKGKNAISR